MVNMFCAPQPIRPLPGTRFALPQVGPQRDLDIRRMMGTANWVIKEDLTEVALLQCPRRWQVSFAGPSGLAFSCRLARQKEYDTCGARARARRPRRLSGPMPSPLGQSVRYSRVACQAKSTTHAIQALTPLVSQTASDARTLPDISPSRPRCCRRRWNPDVLLKHWEG